MEVRDVVVNGTQRERLVVPQFGHGEVQGAIVPHGYFSGQYVTCHVLADLGG